MIGDFSSYMDVAQIVLYAFWIFLFGVIFYLRREDRREGYPLERDSDGKIMSIGPWNLPAPKIFYKPQGGTYSAPNAARDTRPIKATRAANFPGAPLDPTGDPLVDGVGPAAYAERADAPDKTLEGRVRIVPLRTDADMWLAPEDPDPRGMAVVAGCRTTVGAVSDVWVDRAENIIRYLEVSLGGAEGGARAGKTVLVPMPMAVFNDLTRTVTVKSMDAKSFSNVPAPKSAEQITLREEDRIQAYFAGGTLYANK